MDKLTPPMLGMIGLLVLCVFVALTAYDHRAALGALFARYVEVRMPVPASGDNGAERRPQALEQGWDGPEQGRRNMFPDHVAAVSKMTDDQVLTLLALATDEDGEWRYAETRVARFVGGRVEDRQAQVRAIRGEPEPAPPPVRTVPHRVNGEERRLVLD